jgi:hypothetical protein
MPPPKSYVAGKIIDQVVLGGLHHMYEQAA